MRHWIPHRPTAVTIGDYTMGPKYRLMRPLPIFRLDSYLFNHPSTFPLVDC